MFWFIIACLFALVTLGFLLTAKVTKAPGFRIVAAATALITLVGLFFSCTYTQGVGEAKVLKSWTGEVIGHDPDPGFAFKAPTTSLVDFDIRNQQAVYMGDGSTDHNGGKPTGPQITVTDMDGVRNNIDLIVRYSIKPDAVEAIYDEHRSQEVFKSTIIEQDIRSVTRSIPGKYTTQDLLGNRSAVEADLAAALTERWKESGVVLESVAMQEVRPPEEVLQRFADAQAARAEVEKQKALLKAAEVSAQQKVVAAQAEATANNLLTKSLTPEVLKQRELDALVKIGEKGNLIVVPEGSTPFVNVEKAAQ